MDRVLRVYTLSIVILLVEETLRIYSKYYTYSIYIGLVCRLSRGDATFIFDGDHVPNDS